MGPSAQSAALPEGAVRQDRSVAVGSRTSVVVVGDDAPTITIQHT